MENQNKLVIFDFSRTLAGSQGVYPGIAEQIVELKEKGYMLAVVSLAPMSELKNELSQIQAKSGTSLSDMFDVMIGFEGLKMINGGRPDKTSRNVTNHVLAATDAAKSKTVVVGDAFTELLMAKNSGIKYLHAGWDDPEKKGLTCGLNADLPYDEVDVEMAQSIPRVEQIIDRIEAALEAKKCRNPEPSCDNSHDQSPEL